MRNTAGSHGPCGFRSTAARQGSSGFAAATAQLGYALDAKLQQQGRYRKAYALELADRIIAAVRAKQEAVGDCGTPGVTKVGDISLASARRSNCERAPSRRCVPTWRSRSTTTSTSRRRHGRQRGRHQRHLHLT